MNDGLRALEEWLVNDRSSRRNVLVRGGRAALALVAGIALPFVTVPTAYARRSEKCCSLTYPNDCPNETCPGTCHCYTWTCCNAATSNNCVFVCGECDAQQCSFWYANGLKCGPGGPCNETRTGAVAA
jgi:hypothetical protein